MCVFERGGGGGGERHGTPVNLLEQKSSYCVCASSSLGGQAYLLQGNLLSEPLAYLERDDIINNQNC